MGYGCFRAPSGLARICQFLENRPGCSLCCLVCILQGLLHHLAGSHCPLIRLPGCFISGLPHFRGRLHCPLVRLVGQHLGRVLRGPHGLRRLFVDLPSHVFRLLLQGLDGARHPLPGLLSHLAEASRGYLGGNLSASLHLPRVFRGPSGGRCQGLLENAGCGPGSSFGLAHQCMELCHLGLRPVHLEGVQSLDAEVCHNASEVLHRGLCAIEVSHECDDTLL
mmetsp:Transcript_44849/g.124706  ORF Transcript_44849/g.124706 Transcript_44849/m.124706 type:complete len:222 (+) Transcript_44849:595-1260(+)